MEEEQSYKLLVDSIKDYAIFMLDPHGFIITWNPGAENLKGYKKEEIIKKHFSIFYTHEAIERNHPEFELKTAIKTGRFEEDTHTSFDEFRWTSDVNLLSDFYFDEGQIEIFQKFYKFSHADLNYIYFESFEDIREFSIEKGKYVHLLLIDDFLVWPIYKVDESEKIDEYYHGY